MKRIILLNIALLFTLNFSQTAKAQERSNVIRFAKPDTASVAKPKEEDEDKERQGPANLPFEILNQISADHEFESNNGILNIFRKVYRDANPLSGYYYYLPAEYNLNWRQDRGGEYAFYVTFKAATGSGRGEAVVTAELKPNITRKDIDIAKELLMQDIKNDPVAKMHPVSNLVSMPLASPPKISFAQIQNYGVNPADIIVRTPTDFLDPIVISWKMERVDDLLLALFNNVGLNGNLTLEPDGEGMPAIEIPINLKIDDPKTYGKFEMEGSSWRTNGWQNATDYPVVMKNLHVLRLKNTGGTLQSNIYTWRMGNAEVPEKASAKFDTNLVPAWLDNDPTIKRIWIEYAVQPCQSCNQAVRDKILGGVSSNQINAIDITTLSPLSFSGAKMMRIRIRSHQADPSGLSKVDLPTITISQDFATASGGQLFIDQGQKPDYEYLITLYMSDGTKYESDNWQKSSDLEIVIGEKQIRDQISHFRN
ncbi:MAG: hypothetical protein R3D00_23785 [Bacteroidia bacterium]